MTRHHDRSIDPGPEPHRSSAPVGRCLLPACLPRQIEHSDGSVTTLVRSDRFDFKQSQVGQQHHASTMEG